MRKFIPFLLAIFFSICINAQNPQDEAWVRENYTKQEQYITMRDGVKLFTTIYLPRDTSEKHPILMARTPYSCAPYGKDNYAANLWTHHLRYYCRENYILVVQDVRGKWMSEGEFEDVRPFIAEKKTNSDIDEASDTYDAIDWLVKNLPYNNGRVGAFGTSYPGFYSTMAAASGHPALKAVSPQAPVTNWFIGDDFHHNGAFFQMDGFAFYSFFGKPRPKPTTEAAAWFDYKIKDNYQFYLQAGTLKKLSEYMGDSIPFWKQLYAHPNYDDWWKARDARVAMHNIKPAMLLVGGLFDAEDCWGAWNLYKAIERQSAATDSRIVMGPWYHGQWSSHDGSSLGNIQFGSNTAYWYQNNVEIPFFNYHLKQKGSAPALAEATIFFTGRNEWKQFSQWPPADVRTQHLYLNADASLTNAAAKTGSRTYTSDPAHPVPYTEDVHHERTREYMIDDQRFAARRPDVLTYMTDPLEQDLVIAGPVNADLKVSITGTDADFIVKVIDVFPDNFDYSNDSTIMNYVKTNEYPMGGYQMLVRGEIMRGKYRKSLSEPVAFKPGQKETVAFELPDVAHTFRKGHRLMVQVQSSWFPLVDRNPQQFLNIYTTREEDFRKIDVRIYNDSRISFPVLSK